MICDKVTYKGQVILTVYHQVDKGNMLNRRIEKKIKIGRYNLIFKESYVNDSEILNITGWLYKEEGLVQPGSTKNPYGDSSCAHMIHYIYTNKPESIYSAKVNQYLLKISVDDFLLISEFVKKYTGIDIKTHPMFCGDIFIFKYHECIYKCNNENGIVLENIPANSTVIVHFKNDDMIVSSKIFKNESDTEKVEIFSDKTWTSHDIEIFIGEKLIYYRRDISYIKHIGFRFNTKSQGKTVKLNKIGTEHTIIKESNDQTLEIGESIDNFENVLSESSKKIKKCIKNEKPDDQVFFIKPNELSKAKNIIIPTIEAARGELWIFDSYFTEKDSFEKSIDWLRIISNCYIDSSNIVFYCNPQKDTAFNAIDFIDIIKKDKELSALLRNKKGLKIHLYQVTSSIHDRFIIIKNNDEFSGLSIGTSFNSLERNHYCIHKLSHAAAKIIFFDLLLWMDDKKIKLKEEI